MKPDRFVHQQKVLDEIDGPHGALFWEQGCAKTRPTIDTAFELHRRGEIDAVLVVAPNGVHRNWAKQFAEWSTGPCETYVYEVPKGRTKKVQAAVSDLIEDENLAVLLVPYSAFNSQHSKNAVWQFMKTRRCLYVLDESHYIKTPSARRTKAILASAKYAPYRRILTGTPYLNSPFDYYSQIQFVDPDFWPSHGFPNLATFKAHFSITKEFQTGNGQRFSRPVAWRNEDELAAILDSTSWVSRLTKDEALPWLPERTYVTVEVDLDRKQRELYDAVTAEYLDEFRHFEESNGLELGDPPPDPMTTLLRLQQITCGYYPTGDDEDLVSIVEDKNRRIEKAVEICDATEGQILIWARFTRDIEALHEALGPDRAALYYGKTSASEKERTLKRFHAGEAQVIVANPAAGIGRGHTLNESHTTIYFSNSYNLEHRLQSEARNHRAGQKNAVTYYDLIAPSTIDVQILASLRGKIEMAATINGDTLADWVEIGG